MEANNEKRPQPKDLLLKYKNCSEIKGDLYRETFFLCSETSKTNYILCRYCATTCHKGHEHSTLSIGNYDCFCAKNDHKPLLDISIKSKTNEMNCIYQELFKETPNEGFDYAETENSQKNKVTLTYCAICLDKCVKLKSKGKVTNEQEKICHCPNHEACNAHLIFQDLKRVNKKGGAEPKGATISKTAGKSKPFMSYLKNFNFNIMIKSNKVNEVTGKELIKILENIDYNPKKILKDSNIQAILELFTVFSFKWKNKFFYANGNFNEKHFRKICSLVDEKANPGHSKEKQYKYFKNQIYWINLIFSIYVRGNYISKHNLWSLSTIQNMNIYQRFKYIFEKDTTRAESFSSYNSDEEKKVKEIIQLLLKYFESIIRGFEEKNDINKIYHEIFPLFNKMMKFVLKYNLCTEEQSRKYFELVFEIIKKRKDFEIIDSENTRSIKSIQIITRSVSRIMNEQKALEKKKIVDIDDTGDYESQRDKEIEAIDDPFNLMAFSHLLIMKSIFYYLLYTNDVYVMKMITSTKKMPKTFIFTDQQDIVGKKTLEDIKYIFYSILMKSDGSSDQELNSITNIQTKIFNFMTQKKNNFYVNSLNNIKLLPESQKTKSEIQSSFETNLEVYVTQLRKLSRNYFTYKIKFEEYGRAIDEIMAKFKEFITNSFELYDLSISFLNFIKKNDNEPKKQEVQEFQKAVKNSMLFQALEEIIHISGFAGDYLFKAKKQENNDKDKAKAKEGKGKKEPNKEKEEEIPLNIKIPETAPQIALTPTKDTRLFILQLYYLLITNDHENVCLFMNIKVKPYVLFFDYIAQHFLYFCYRFIEILYSSPYYYANCKFLTEALSHLSELIKGKQDNILHVSSFFKIYSLLLKKDSKLNLISIGKAYDKVFPLKKVEDFKNLITPYLKGDKDFFKNSTKENHKYKIELVIQSFFEFASAYESLDFSKYINLDKSFDKIMDYKIIPSIFNSFLNEQPSERLIDVRVIYPLLKYYIQRILPFNLHISNNEYMMAFLLDELSLSPNDQDQKISNTSLINICRIQGISYGQIDQVKAQVEKLLEIIDFITNIAINYDKIFLEYINSPTSFQCPFHMKIDSYCFIQNILIKPSYYLIKSIEVYLPYIEGIQFEHLLKLIFHILKAIDFFYNNIEAFNQDDNDKYKDLNSFEEFNRYIQLEIKLKLSRDNLINIKKTIINLSHIKFFKVKEYMEKYEDIILKVYEFNPPALLTNNTVEKKIDSIIKVYEEKIAIGSELVNFSSKIISCEVLKSDYFKIITKSKPLNFQIENLERIQFFISIMESISDIKNYHKPEQKKEIADILQKYADENLIHQFLTLICFSNITEITRLFNLCLTDEMKQLSVNTYVNTTLTNFFQILCEGNNTMMKNYLFKAMVNKDIVKRRNVQLDDLNKNNPKSTEQSKVQPKKGKLDITRTVTGSKWGNLKVSHNPVIPEETGEQELSKIENKSILKSSRVQLLEKSKTAVENKDGQHQFIQKKQLQTNASQSRMVRIVGEVTEQNRKRKYKSRNLNIMPEIDDQKASLTNIIFNNMKMIHSRYRESEKYCLTNRIFQDNKLYLNINTNALNFGYKTLIVEMVQGYTFEKDIFSKSRDINEVAPFGFYYLCQEMSVSLFERDKEMDFFYIDVRIDLFNILQNIIRQKYNFSKANFITFFKCMNLNRVLICLMKYLYLFYCRDLKPTNPEFNNNMKNIVFNDTILQEMIEKYKRNWEIYQDKYFQLSQNIYFYLRFLYEKFKDPMATRFMTSSLNNFEEATTTSVNRIAERRAAIGLGKDQNKNSSNKNNKGNNVLKKKSAVAPGDVSERKGKKSQDDGQNPNENEKEIKEKPKTSEMEKNIRGRIFSYKFFHKIIQKIEISVDKDNSPDNQKENKKILFLIEPETYVVNDKEMERLFKDVDRSSRRKKLLSVLDSLPELVTKIKYKTKNKQNEKWLWLTNFEYSRIDLFNCIFAIIINLTFLKMLDRNQTSAVILSIVSMYMEIVLIAVNLFFLCVFLFTKYPMYIYLINKKYEHENPSLWKFVNVYLVDSFILNDEVKKMIIITIFGYLGIATKYDIILFTFQLLTIGTFITTIQEILSAFIMRFTQLISMIIFLAIFTFFYANYDFYFLRDQFMLEQEGGIMVSACSSLLECYLTLFNNGVRSGGGIGDILGETAYFSFAYFERWIHDMIFFIVVILLLLNMINGVIVSTFSQLREESTAKEEDMNNICFICSIPRYELIKQKNTFFNHYKNEHNLKCYVRYLVSLYFIDDKDMDQDQYYVFNRLGNRSLDFFPIYDRNNNEEEDDE